MTVVSIHRLLPSKEFLINCLFAFASLFSVALLYFRPLVLAIVLLALSAAMLIFNGKKRYLALFVMCGACGAGAEALAIGFGAWHYSFSNIIGVPYWLPFLWGMAGVFMKLISLEIIAIAGRFTKIRPPSA